MHQRYQSIQPPSPGTCNWLFEDLEFRAWQDTPHNPENGTNSVLWLLGKPGSGKSVLVREAEHRISREDEKGTIYLSYFFDAKGTTDLQRSPEGAYRFFLHQLLSLPSQRSSLRYAASKYVQKLDSIPIGHQTSVSWTETELKHMIREILLHPRQEACCFRIFIDAVDECGGESRRDMASFFQGLTYNAADAKICFSARHFSFVPNFRGSSIITVDTNNHGDILHYLNMSLFGNAEMVSLRNAIAEMASGVFLWVVFVVDMVVRHLDRGRNMRFVHEQLQKVPRDLDTLFHDLLLEPLEDRFVTPRLLYWACLGGELRIREWRHILPFIRRPVPKSLAECKESEYYAEVDEQVEKQIRHISLGLVEVARPAEPSEHESDECSVNAGAGSLDPDFGESRIVQLIHGSVREFFLNNKGFECLGFSFYPIADGYLSIISTCLDYINVSELDGLALARERTRPKRLPSVESFHEQPQSRRKHGVQPLTVKKYVEINWEGINLKRSARSGDSSAGSFCSASSFRYSRFLGQQTTALQAGAFQKPKLLLSESMGGDPPVAPFSHLQEYLSNQHVTAASRSSLDVPTAATSSIGTTHTVSSFGLQSCLLEDYPALLSYVLTTLFFHMRSVNEQEVDLQPIWERMDNGMWKRWSSLWGDIPSIVTLAEWAGREELVGAPKTVGT